MAERLKRVSDWLIGRRLLLLGGMLIVGAVAAAATGYLSPIVAVQVGGAGLALFGAAAKSERHHQELIAAIQEAAVLGAAARSGGTKAVSAQIKNDLPHLVQQQMQEGPQ